MQALLQSLFDETSRVIVAELARRSNVEEFDEFAARLRARHVPAAPGTVARRSVVDEWFDRANGAAGAWFELAEHLAAASSALGWVRAYDELASTPELESFRAHYAWAPLAGPKVRNVVPPVVRDDLLVGFTLQAPHVTYPHHHHAAPELYGVISGTVEWQIGDGPWLDKRPGDVVVHHTNASHSMRSGAEPVLTWVMWPCDPHSDVLMPGFEPDDRG